MQLVKMLAALAEFMNECFDNIKGVGISLYTLVIRVHQVGGVGGQGKQVGG